MRALRVNEADPGGGKGGDKVRGKGFGGGKVGGFGGGGGGNDRDTGSNWR
jgi:hypothetical protein